MRQGSVPPCILLCLFMTIVLLSVGRPSVETFKNERFYNLVIVLVSHDFHVFHIFCTVCFYKEGFSESTLNFGTSVW